MLFVGDLAIMERLVDLYDLVAKDDGKISLKELVDEMVRTSESELDFGNEAANLERFHRNNEPRENVTSPVVPISQRAILSANSL